MVQLTCYSFNNVTFKHIHGKDVCHQEIIDTNTLVLVEIIKADVKPCVNQTNKICKTEQSKRVTTSFSCIKHLLKL